MFLVNTIIIENIIDTIANNTQYPRKTFLKYLLILYHFYLFIIYNIKALSEHQTEAHSATSFNELLYSFQ